MNIKMVIPFETGGADYQNFMRRRKILEGLLKSEGVSWKDVLKVYNQDLYRIL